jgi:abhydrolase domain-containing protein 17
MKPTTASWMRRLFGRWSLWRPIQSLAAIYLLLLLVAVFLTDWFLFLPPTASYDRSLPGWLELKGSDGATFSACHLPARPGMPTLLYSHGNAEDIGHNAELFEIWHQQGFGVMAYDYPGYGLSPGKPSEAACERAIEATWQHLLASGVAAESIALVCRSVGSGPGVWLASRHRPAGLVLIAPFRSVYSVPFRQPIFPRDRFPNERRLRDIDLPLLILHGENDEVIPFHHGQRLFAVSPSADKRLLPIPAAGHNDLFHVAGDAILAEIAAFATRVATP